MPDRDKVIKAFEICDNNEDGIVCKNCPYKEDKWNGAWEDETGKTCFQTLHADALALLKEQEKVKVVFGRSKDGSFVTECGNCGTYLDKAYSKCPKCNKELDWNSNQN